jgi:hypothetical protein
VRHAQGLQHFGVAQRRLDILRGAAAFLLHLLQRAAAQAIVEPGKRQHHHGGERRAHAERRMERPDHGDVKDHPRRVEQRDQAVGGKQGAQRGDVAHAVGAAAVAGARRDRDHRAHHRR